MSPSRKLPEHYHGGVAGCARTPNPGPRHGKERHTEHKKQNQKRPYTERNSFGRDPYPPKGEGSRTSAGRAVEVEPGYQKGALWT